MCYLRKIDDVRESIKGTKCESCPCMKLIPHDRHDNALGAWRTVRVYEAWCGHRHATVDPKGVECSYELPDSKTRKRKSDNWLKKR